MKKKIINRKVVILGDSSVGKTSIVDRLKEDEFTDYKEPTIGAAYASIILEKDLYQIKLDIWDTAGQERYRSLTPMYYRNTDYALIVFDLTNNSSYDNSLMWIDELKKNSKNANIILLGNKKDLIEKSFTSEINFITYLEISAKTNENIDEIKNIIKNLDKDIEQENKDNIQKIDNEKKIISYDKCCY